MVLGRSFGVYRYENCLGVWQVAIGIEEGEEGTSINMGCLKS
jgi:hypothetical protein